MSVNADRGRNMIAPQYADAGQHPTNVTDCTAQLQRPARDRRWFGAAAFALTSIVFAGCGNAAAPTLRDAGKGLDELRSMLADPDPEVQARGALGLSRLGAEARDAVPELVPLLKSPSGLARQNAALALAAVGPEAKAAVPELTAALKDADWAVRRQAATALGAIGADAKSAVPELKRLDADPQKLVRDAAKQARAKIGG